MFTIDFGWVVEEDEDDEEEDDDEDEDEEDEGVDSTWAWDAFCWWSDEEDEAIDDVEDELNKFWADDSKAVGIEDRPTAFSVFIDSGFSSL